MRLCLLSNWWSSSSNCICDVLTCYILSSPLCVMACIRDSNQVSFQPSVFWSITCFDHLLVVMVDRHAQLLHRALFSIMSIKNCQLHTVCRNNYITWDWIIHWWLWKTKRLLRPSSGFVQSVASPSFEDSCFSTDGPTSMMSWEKRQRKPDLSTNWMRWIIKDSKITFPKRMWRWFVICHLLRTKCIALF